MRFLNKISIKTKLCDNFHVFNMIAEYYRVPKVLFVANDVGENGSERFNIEKKICRDFVYKHFMRRVLYDSAD